MLYIYKDAFSFWDEIGTYPNIDAEIDTADKSPFLIRPYHVTYKKEQSLIERWKGCAI